LATKNKKIPIYGDGKNIRDWIFVFDHCKAIWKILEKGRSGESYNISANNEISNIVIVKKILELLHKPFTLIKFVKDRPGHDYRYSLNSSKLYKKTNWKPSVNFEKGLTHTINWYLTNHDWWNKLSSKKFGRIN
ncbi:MAG: GDP-mannose 4,6-dehydratase, partial [Nitrosarchaeum sp.]|nr:GDP-mannose 4,6-dehydratase [Nitrosarchaeum sp.]